MSYTTTLLDEAQQALMDGRRDDVWRIVGPIVRSEPANARAWRLLAAVAENPDDAQSYRIKADRAESMQHAPAPPFYGPPTPHAVPGAYGPPHSAASAIPVPRAQGKSAPVAGGVLIGAAVAMIVGSFLPWVVVRVGLLQQAATGMEGDGTLTMGGGVLVLLAGIGLLVKSTGTLRLLGAIFAGGVGYVAYHDLQNILDQSRQGLQASGASALLANATISVGMGLYVILIGVIVAIIGAGLQIRR